jgi:regulator of protease activity HflC (stomatin/prohibitin superfamily)
MDVLLIVLGIAAGIFLIYAAIKSVCLVPQARAQNVERLGRYRATLQPGLHLLIPFADRLRPMIDLREQVLSIREPVITKDNVDLRIDTVLYFRVFDPYQADYGIADYFRAIEKLTGTTLRNTVGDLTLAEALTSRDVINKALLKELNATSGSDWGITVTRVEVMTIELPPSIKEAMEQREGAILRAEGEAEAIERVFAAIHEGHPDPELLAYQYLRMLPRLAEGQGSTVVVIPSELTNVLKSVGTAFGTASGDSRAPGTIVVTPPDNSTVNGSKPDAAEKG